MAEARVDDPVEDLGRAFARGDADLEQVYRAHGALVHAIARKAVGDEAAAEITQDVFLSAWRARTRFDPALGTLAGWLVGIAKRRTIDHLRKERRHVEHRADVDPSDDPAAAGQAGSRAPVAAADVDRIADRMVVAHALRRLAPRARQVIALAYVEGLTHEQIAERTGLPLGTIKSDIRRGLVSLRDHVHLDAPGAAR